jgi:hypothetical protein
VYLENRLWHEGDLEIPRSLKLVCKDATTPDLLGIPVVWTYRDAVDKLLMVGEDPAWLPYLWAARLMFAGVVAGCLLLIRAAWNRRRVGEGVC